MKMISPNRASEQFRVNVPGAAEGIRQPLYDYQEYAAAGQTSLTFFATPAGSNSKTKADTNMTLAGQLPAPQSFLLQQIEIDFFPGVSPTPAKAATASAFLNDVWAVGKGGLLTLNIMSKVELELAPLNNFPCVNRISGFAAASDVTAAAAAQLQVINYGAWGGPVFKVAPMLIKSSQNFSVVLSWPTAVALPSTVAGRIGVKLGGVLYRAVQ